MTTSTKTRRPVKRIVNVSKPTHGIYAMHLIIGEGEKARHYGYYLTPLAVDFGLGFHVEKFGTEQVEGEPAEYDVNIDLRHGHHSCECLGNQRWGHCKHVEAVLAAIKAGRVKPLEEETMELTAKPLTPVMINTEEPMACVLLGGERHRQAMTTKPWCEHCGDDPTTFCRHCSI